MGFRTAPAVGGGWVREAASWKCRPSPLPPGPLQAWDSAKVFPPYELAKLLCLLMKSETQEVEGKRAGLEVVGEGLQATVHGSLGAGCEAAPSG